MANPTSTLAEGPRAEPAEGPGRRLARLVGWDGLALILAPVAVLVADRDRFFPTMIHDPFIYLGFALDPLRMLARFDGTYYATRLSVILPAALAHAALPPLAAHYALHLLMYYAGVAALFVTILGAVGRRAAFLASLVMATDPFYLDAMGRDYSDAFGILYLLLATALAGSARRRPLASAAAGTGAFSALMVVANLSYVIFVPFPAAYLLVAAPGPRRRPAVAIAGFVAGAATPLALLGLFYRSITGDFWFLRGSTNFAASFMNQNGASPFKFPDLSWMGSALWLVVPTAVLLASLPAIRRSIGAPRRLLVDPAAFFPIQLAATFGLTFALDRATNTIFLQAWFYASLLIPATSMALGALLAGPADSLSPRGYASVAAAAAVALIGQAVVPWRYRVDPFPWGLPAAVPAIALAILALAILAPRRPAALAASVTLLAASMFAARAGFSERNGCPIFSWTSLLYTYVRPPSLEVLLPYHVRIHEYDETRAEAFEAIVEVVRYVREHDSKNDVRYWFDLADPYGLLYDNLTCTRTFGAGILNFNFPNIRGGPMADGVPLGPGQLIVLASVHPEALDYARKAMRSIRFGLRLVGRREIRRGPIAFTVYLVETVDLGAGAVPPGLR